MVEHIRHPPSKRNDAGGNPAGSSIARWCQSSMAVCYTVRCWCESNPGSQFQGVTSAADGLVRNEEDAGAIPATLTILRKAGRYKLAAPVSKTGPALPGREHYSRLPPLFFEARKQIAHHSPDLIQESCGM